MESKGLADKSALLEEEIVLDQSVGVYADQVDDVACIRADYRQIDLCRPTQVLDGRLDACPGFVEAFQYKDVAAKPGFEIVDEVRIGARFEAKGVSRAVG